MTITPGQQLLKEYFDDVLEWRQPIKRLKNFGITLNEFTEIIDVKKATCDNVNELVDKKVVGRLKSTLEN